MLLWKAKSVSQWTHCTMFSPRFNVKCAHTLDTLGRLRRISVSSFCQSFLWSSSVSVSMVLQPAPRCYSSGGSRNAVSQEKASAVLTVTVRWSIWPTVLENYYSVDNDGYQLSGFDKNNKTEELHISFYQNNVSKSKKLLTPSFRDFPVLLWLQYTTSLSLLAVRRTWSDNEHPFVI